MKFSIPFYNIRQTFEKSIFWVTILTRSHSLSNSGYPRLCKIVITNQRPSSPEIIYPIKPIAGNPKIRGGSCEWTIKEEAIIREDIKSPTVSLFAIWFIIP